MPQLGGKVDVGDDGLQRLAPRFDVSGGYDQTRPGHDLGQARRVGDDDRRT